MYTKKNSTGNHLRSHLRAIMALDHSRLGVAGSWKTNQIECLRSTSLLYKILPTNLGACKPTFYTFYSSHLRRNSTMRRCIYHTDLGQNALFHNSVFKTNCTQSIFRTINRGLLAKPFKKFPKSPIRPAGSHFWQAPNFRWTSKELRFNIIKNLLCLFFYLMVL